MEKEEREMTNDKCVECGRPVNKEGASAFCDYHHIQALRISELAIKCEIEGKEPQIECSHCHNFAGLETSYFLPGITLCRSCYQNDKSLWK